MKRVKERTLFLAQPVAESKSKRGRPPACSGGSQSALPAAFGLICNEKTYHGKTGQSLSHGRSGGRTQSPGTAAAGQHCSEPRQQGETGGSKVHSWNSYRTTDFRRNQVFSSSLCAG